jgi:type II secretion system protein I
MSRRCSPSAAGFTLIEALIAIVLVAAVLPVALAAISHVTQSVSRLQKQAIALRLADSRLAAWLLDGSWQTAPASGDFTVDTDGDDVTGFHWQLAASAWRDPTVQQLHLTVTWDPPAAANAVSLDTLVTPPATTAATTTASVTP